MVKVKICGITNRGDAFKAIDFGADALGFVFYEGSPRYISPEAAREIVSGLPPFVLTAGVFVDEKKEGILNVINHAGLNVAQLHGDEPPEACMLGIKVVKAIRVKELKDLELFKAYRVSAFLLDTYSPDAFGGTGQIFNWDIAVAAKQFGKVILAGGLTPENVKKAVELVQPYAVDVSSGVEKEKGKKDYTKMRLFIERAKTVVPLKGL